MPLFLDRKEGKRTKQKKNIENQKKKSKNALIQEEQKILTKMKTTDQKMLCAVCSAHAK